MNLRVVVTSIAVRGIVVVAITVAVTSVTPTFFKLAGFSFNGYLAIRCGHLVYEHWSCSAQGHQAEQSTGL